MLDPEHWNPEEPESILCDFGEIFLTIDEELQIIKINFTAGKESDVFDEGFYQIDMNEYNEDEDEEDIDILTYLQIQIHGALMHCRLNDLTAHDLQVLIMDVLEKVGFTVLTSGFEDEEYEKLPYQFKGIDPIQNDSCYRRES